MRGRNRISVIIVVSICTFSISNALGFEPELYDGFFIEYGKCEITVESDDEFFEILITKTMKEQIQGSFCNLIEEAKFEYDYTSSDAIWTHKITNSESEQVRFFTTGDDGRIKIVLPNEWQKGDPLRMDVGSLTQVNYNGVKQLKINDKNIQVYEFVGEAFPVDKNFVGLFEGKYQYDVSSGFLVSHNFKIKMATAAGYQHYSATAELSLNTLNISEPPIISKITSAAEDRGGCLIATATYGSELSLQVQKLRELRDNVLLNTNSGTVFITTFNDFYYSFSPTIADWERQNSLFKEAVKIGITPLLASLSILNYVDMDSEAEVLGYGISLFILNIGMYIVAPIGIGLIVKRKI